MFTREALELLQETAVRASSAELELDNKVLLLPDGINVVDTEPYSDGRYRFRGVYLTASLPSFLTYIRSRNTERAGNSAPTHVFIDAPSGTAKAFFNLGDESRPGHGDDIAKLEITRTAAFEAMRTHTVTRLNQQKLAEFLEDWSFCIAPFYTWDDESTSDTLPLGPAIAAVRDITITKKAETSSVEKDLAASRSTMAQVEARSRNTLPTGFMFTAAPFPGFKERAFTLRLSVVHGSDDVALVLRAVGLEQVMEEVADEFEELVRGVFSDDTNTHIYRGTFNP